MPSVSVRSLMRMEAGGLVMSIPRPWARFHKLQAGDKVEVITNGKLVIKPLSKPRES